VFSPYHEASIKQVNDQVRIYNVIAPYAVRRGIYNLESELQDCFRESAPQIIAELEKRVKEGFGPKGSTQETRNDGVRNRVAEKEEPAIRESMLSALMRLYREVVAK